MKETLYTIPLNDAFLEDDECPFCNIERKLERDALDYILGSASAYMETDVRAQTNKLGFCRKHYKDMFQYGNALGNAIMLTSYFKYLNEDLKKKMTGTTPGKAGLFSRFKKNQPEEEPAETALSSWLRSREKDCFVCKKFEDTYKRYIDTFFMMVRSDEDFYKRVKDSKGFCLHHFADITEAAEKSLSGSFKEQFFSDMFDLMKKNMDRVEEDLCWFVEKFDYRNRDADWKNSRDAVPRAMQKIAGGYPADDFYKSKK